MDNLKTNSNNSFSIYECNDIYGITVCLNDVVEIYPRARGLSYFIGIVRYISNTAIVIENEKSLISIRYSDIKMIRKPKIKQ